MAKAKLSKVTLSKQNILGWYGVLAILFAYGLLTFKVFQASSLPYQLLNLTGAGGIMYETAAKKDLQPVVLNAIWGLVALIAIIRILVS